MSFLSFNEPIQCGLDSQFLMGLSTERTTDRVIWFYMFCYRSLPLDDGIITDVDVICDTTLTVDDHIIADHGIAGNACLGDDFTACSNFDIVPDLHQISNLGMRADDSVRDGSTLYGGVAADHGIVSNQHPADSGKRNENTARYGMEKAIDSDSSARSDMDSISEGDSAVDVSIRSDHAVIP